MSFNSEYQALRKKRKKQEKENQIETVSGIPIKTSDARPRKATNQGESEVERTWFTKGKFEDGYDFGDVTKTILGTAGDIGANLIGSLGDISEGILNVGASAVGGVAGLLGNEKLKKETEYFIKEDKVYGADDVTDFAEILTGVDVDEVSVLGEKSDSVVQSGGQLLTSSALQTIGVPWWATMGTTSFGGKMNEALNEGATYNEALVSSAISTGAELLTEKLSGGVKFGGRALDDAFTPILATGISNKFVRTAVKLGMDVTGEGAEEVLSQAISNFGDWLTYRDDEELEEVLASEEAVDEYIEAFMGGGLIGGIAGGVKTGVSAKKGVDYTSQLTANEEKVVNSIYENRIKESKTEGKKVTQREKNKIYDDVIRDLKKGYISTDTIESVLGGDTYKEYKKGLDKEDSLKNEEKTLREEFNTLNRMENGKMTGEQVDRREELRTRLEELKTQISQEQNSKSKSELKSKLSAEVSELAKADRLSESYNEKERKSKVFEADLSKYSAKEQETVQRAVESGILNNTNRTHDFVDMVAKLSAEKGVLFDFTNNEKLKESGLALENVSVDGYIQGKNIAVNIDSVKALNTVVGHEIAHVLEGSELYTAFADEIKQYAMSKGVYDAKLQSIAKLYEGVEDTDIDAEVTADLVGELLFTDSEFINRLSAEQPNIFKRVFNEIKYLCRIAAAGSKEARQLEKVKKTFEDAYRENTSTEGENSTKYSVSDVANADEILYNKDNPLSVTNRAKTENKSSIKWVYNAEIFSVIENKLFHEKISEINQGSNAFSKAANGEYMIPIENKIVFTDGNYDSPQISEIVEVLTDSATEFDVIKETICDVEAGKLDKSEEMRVLKEVFGTGSILSYKSGNGAVYGWEDGRRKGKTRSSVIRNYINKQIRTGNGGKSQGTGIKKSIPIEKASSTDDVFFDASKRSDTKFSLSDKNEDIAPVKKYENYNANVNSDISLIQDSDGRELTEAQQEYFKDSKVRDENGNLLVVYHGTNEDFTVFDKTKGRSTMDIQGSFFSPWEIDAGGYGKNVKAYYLNIKKPASESLAYKALKMFQGQNYAGVKAREYLESLGYDGVNNSNEEYIAFNSNQIKLIDNNNPTLNKDIRYSLSSDNETANADSLLALAHIPDGDYNVHGKDVALAPTAEDIARMKENTVPDGYAPTAEDIAPVRNDMQTPSNDIAPIRSDIKQNDDIGPVRELSVKEQLNSNNKVLNEMEVVSSVNEDKTFTSKQDVAEWALKKFEKIGFKVSRKGFGEIIIDKRRVKKGLSYLKTNEERLALAAVPQVLSDGVQIGGHTLHKGRAYNTLTFAAPVEINGQRGNLAVVVRQEGKNYYKVHRLIMPDGKQFVLYKNKEDIAETVGGVENGSGLSPTDNVFNDIIPQTTVNGQENSLNDDIGPVRDDIQDVKNIDFTLLDDIPAVQENVAEIDGADISVKSKERIKNELIKANNKIDADFSYEKNSLIDEFNKRRELLEKKTADKNVYFTENAAKLYNELIKLKKGVKASDDLGYLLDSLDSKNWGTLKAALVNTRNFPGRVVNSDSAIEGVVREMLEEQYNSDVAELESIDASLNEELEKLKEKADERRKSAKLAVNGKLAREIIDSEVVKLMGDTSFWKDKRLGISYKTNTERRNFRDIVKDKNGKPQYKVADALYDYFMGTYNHNEASLNREANKVRQEYAELKLNKYEDAFVQIKGEFLHNPHSELTQHDVDTFLKLHGKHIDESKVDKTIDMARKTYDSLIERMNDVLVAHGMKPIEYRSGYFPHFSEPKQGVFAKLLNWKIQDNEIPTDIAGLTESFKPNRSWQSFNKQRISDETDYSFAKGFDRYLQGSLDWIYHIDDIMKRRVFENRIRYDHSDKGIKAQIDEIYKSNEYDSNEKQNQIDMVFREAGNPLNNFIQDFRARTNTLAGKKSSMDRGMEEITSRKFYSTMSNLNNKISGNMVAGSVSSALTNFIPITQSWLQVSPKSSLIAMAEVMKNAYSNDGTVDKSDFLTNRLRKSENLHQTGWDKASKAVTWLMEGIDSFTSQTVWRSKYNENISKGMSEAEAIKNADQFAENVLAGRSRGNMPTIFDSKNPLLKIATAFQLEVNNQYGYMFKDAPQDMKNESKAKLLKGYATMFIGAYAYNTLYSALTGRDAAFDPIGIVEELLKDLGVFGDDEDEEKEINIPETAMNLFDNVLEEMPFVSGLVGGGRIPLSSALPYGDNIRDAIEGNITDISEGDWENLTKEWLGSAGAYVLAPIGGGQLRKTVQGLMMFDDDLPIAGSYTDNGKLRFTAKNDLPHKIQSALFGQYSSSTARQYFDEGRSPLNEKQMEELIQIDIPIEKYWEYKDGLKALGKNATFEEKADYIANLEGYSTEQKNIMVNNLTSRKTPIDLTGYEKYGDIEELDYATKNPEKYTVAKSVGGYDSYKAYLKELNNIKSVKDENGKTVSGSRKEKVLNYINNLDAEYGEKLILFKSEYPSDDTYNYEIVEYLNGRDDISREEMETILKELGFDVYPDGTVKW